MRLPGVVIFGASRSGTSSLFASLMKHPKLQPPKPGGAYKWKGHHKELHFFDKHYDRGLRWYASQWPEAGGKILYEATPNYLYYGLAPERARRDIPDALFICMLRDPVERAWSHFHRTKAKKPLRALKKPKALWNQKGIYKPQLRRWFEQFPASQILVLKSEDYFEDPQSVLTQCFRLIGIEDVAVETDEYWDPLKWIGKKPGMPDDCRRWLRGFFRPHNQSLYKYLRRDFEWQ